jgi:hypothetical protein
MTNPDGQELTEAERHHLRTILREIGPGLRAGMGFNCIICREVNLYLAENEAERTMG